MCFSLGEKFKITIFGQSHAPAVGVVMEGLPPGQAIDLEKVGAFMAKRAPGKSILATKRREDDIPIVLSGLLEGKSCGSPIAVMIENTDARGQDYSSISSLPRPGHADFAAHHKYLGMHDKRGGGHFSGRLTAALCFAGGVAIQILEAKGVSIAAHILSVGSVDDRYFDAVNVSRENLDRLWQSDFPLLDETRREPMHREILDALDNHDSVGGSIECAALGVPAGVGGPLFGGIEGKMALAMFGIPAVKAIEFGAGFAAAKMRGSEHNDQFIRTEGQITTKTNNHGGILGGISTGMPIIVRAAFKPTPSIGLKQQTVDLDTMEETEIRIEGRHDPCIVPRAVACVEAAMAVVLLDMML